MEVTFLGTSSGTPTATRNVSGAAISASNAKAWYLVDCGEGTQHRVLQSRYSLNQLQAILISHIHGDHCYGLPGLLASAAMGGRLEPLKIICPAGVINFMRSMVEETDLRLSYEIDYIDIATIEFVQLKDFGVDIIPLSHRVPSFGFRFSEMLPDKGKLNVPKLLAENVPKGELWGRLQKGEDITLDDGRELYAKDFLQSVVAYKKLIICGDNDSPELLNPYMEDVGLLIHEATYTEDVALKVGKGPQHSYAKQVASFARQAGLANLILTHFSSRYGDDRNKEPNIFTVEQEAREHFYGTLYLAHDLDCYQMSHCGDVTLKKS